MGEVDGFLNQMMPRLTKAERALHNGDVGPRLVIWSRNDPVTLLGAWLSSTGWEDVSRAFQLLASRFSDCTAYDMEIVAAGASGDLAYTIAYEHTSASIDGARTTYTLRVTQIYRREDGQWKVAHRHADDLADRPGATDDNVVRGGREHRDGGVDVLVVGATDRDDERSTAPDPLDIDCALRDWHDAHRAFMKGDPGSVKALWSHGDDVSVANPFGGAFRGWSRVGEVIDRSISTVRNGEVDEFDVMASHVGSDLAYVVQIEHYRSKADADGEAVPFSLRATMVFRPEGGAWKVLHRHADRTTHPPTRS